MIRQAISCDICAAEKRQTNHWFVAYEQGGELRVSGWSSRHRLRPGSKHLCGQTCLHKLVDEFMAKSIAVRARRAAENDELEMELPEPARNLPAPPAAPENDASLTSTAAFVEDEASSARLLTTAVVVPAVLPVTVFHPSEPKAASSGVLALHPDEPRADSLGTPVIDPSSGVPVIHPNNHPSPQPRDPTSPAGDHRSGEAPASRPQPELVMMPARAHETISVPTDTLRYASRRWRAEAWERERARTARH